MNAKQSKLVRYILGVSFSFISLIYLISKIFHVSNLAWTRDAFFVMMFIVSLYNLFFNPAKKDE